MDSEVFEIAKENDLSYEEANNNIIELGEVLRNVHNPILKEEKIKIKNGKVFWLKKIVNNVPTFLVIKRTFL